MHNIDNYNFSGKRVLIRVDFNVPLNDALEVTDATRIKAAVPTIKKVLEGGGSVVLMSHLGRPKQGKEDKFSLKHILDTVAKEVGVDVLFASDCMGQEALEKCNALKAGEVLLLENLRFYKEETKGDEGFAKKLAGYGEVYINDAFGTAHRAHASTSIIAQYFPEHKLFGYLIQKEIESVSKVLSNGESPTTAIVGGAKVSSKITIIEQLLSKIDNLIIGGGMAYTFAKAQGGEVGSSLVENDFLDVARGILEKAAENNVSIYLPEDTIAANAFDNDAQSQQCATNKIPEGFMGLDIGEKAIATYCDVILNSRTILWNGPMGVFEMSNFQKGTVEMAKAIAAATEKGAFSLVGGGDSVAAVTKFNMFDKVSHVSTGGGAMLEYLEGKVLPGIEAIQA